MNYPQPARYPGAPHDPFFIVGIGASAGGLEALERLLTHLPPDTGLAYVVVLHLDPERESGVVELMRRWTAMPVSQIEDGMPAMPDHVYVIPPNYTIGLMHGRLQLMTPPEPHYRWRPVDAFLRALSQDRGPRSIGVILSGAGTDGSLGVKAIKGAGGLVLVQAPDTATYPSMALSALATGAVDRISAPEDMAQEIIEFVDHAYLLRPQEDAPLPGEGDHLWQKIFFLLRSHTGHDFFQYKQSTIRRRVERRLLVNRIDSMEGYVRYLQHHPNELSALFEDLLIGVTSFFRDRDAFEALNHKAIRALVQRKERDEALRIWINGCSTGEEAYSIAMLVHEQMETLGRQLAVQIFATDIDDNAISKARRGVYGDGIAADVTPTRLQRYFEPDDKGYRVKAVIRDMVVFATHNTVQDPPFSNVDLVSCRNLLIYLGPALQERLIPLIHYALVPDGYLFLGNSETPGQYGRLFRTVDAEARLFQRREVVSPVRPSFDLQSAAELPYQPTGRQKRSDMKKPIDLRQLAETALLEDHTPPAVIVNAGGDILYIHEHTGRYLEPAVGTANLNLLRMAREGLRLLLPNMVRKASQEQTILIEPRVQVRIDDHYETIDLIVRPLAHPEIDDLLLVIFASPSPPPDLALNGEDAAAMSEAIQRRVIDLERELQNTREHLQATVEDLETSNEELKSTNEELQSANEELQSANEELTSAKEELQSVNEELMTVNSELESKIDELSRANDDLRNLLTSVEIGIIFLDERLRILRFNPAATAFLSLRDEDIDRPIAHLVSRMDYSQLVEDAQEVIDTLTSKELEVRMGSGWYMLRIRPYRTIDNIINGVIITIADITDQKAVQHELRKLSRAVDQSTSLIVIMDTQGTVEYANRRFFEFAGFQPQAVLGQPFQTLLADEAAHFGEIRASVTTAGQNWRGELRHRTADDETFWVQAIISPLTDNTGRVTHLIAAEEDISQRKQLEQTLHRRWTARRASSSAPAMALLAFDRDFRYVAGEGRALPGIGLSETDLEGQPLTSILPTDLERHYRAALRGDNIYFERASGALRFGIQVMPVRQADGQIFAGIVVVWDISERAEHDAEHGAENDAAHDPEHSNDAGGSAP